MGGRDLRAGMEAERGRKRGRGAAESGSSPLQLLLEQLRRLKLPAIDAQQANALLAPLVRDCLRVCGAGGSGSDNSLLEILYTFGWREEAPGGGAFTGQSVSLFQLATAVAKYRWVRVQVRFGHVSPRAPRVTRKRAPRGAAWQPMHHPRHAATTPAPRRPPPAARRSWAAARTRSCTRPRTARRTRSSR